MVTVGLHDQVTTEGDKGYAMSRGRAFQTEKQPIQRS